MRIYAVNTCRQQQLNAYQTKRTTEQTVRTELCSMLLFNCIVVWCCNLATIDFQIFSFYVFRYASCNQLWQSSEALNTVVNAKKKRKTKKFGKQRSIINGTLECAKNINKNVMRCSENSNIYVWNMSTQNCSHYDVLACNIRVLWGFFLLRTSLVYYQFNNHIIKVALSTSFVLLWLLIEFKGDMLFGFTAKTTWNYLLNIYLFYSSSTIGYPQ